MGAAKEIGGHICTILRDEIGDRPKLCLFAPAVSGSLVIGNERSPPLIACIMDGLEEFCSVPDHRLASRTRFARRKWKKEKRKKDKEQRFRVEQEALK